MKLKRAAGGENPILIGGVAVTDKGRFHTDFTQNDGSSCVNLRDRVEATDAEIAMKTKKAEKYTGEELSPPSGPLMGLCASVFVFMGTLADRGLEVTHGSASVDAGFS